MVGGLAATAPGANDASRLSGISFIRGPSWLQTPLLTLGLFGISIVWSVEMSYASPYLLSLGMSKSAMAVVFVAGPLSGLVMQPIIGVLADSNTSRWGRRRPYMIIGTILCVFAMMLLGWTKEVAGIFSSQISLTLWLAVVSVYLIDFSVNAVMAVDRALLVDMLPATLQPSGNAWAARMAGIGGVVGYYAGNLDLPSLFPIFGHTELQILSVLVSFILLGSHIVVASSVRERVLLKSSTPGVGGPLAKSFTTEVRSLFENMNSLPRLIRQIFLIQFFTWISWFPIMFYSTLYIGDLYKRAFFATAILMPPPEITEDSLAALDTAATRIGSRALFYSSILCLFMNIVLPFFVTEASSSSRRRKQERQRGVRFVASDSYEPHGAQNGLDELARSPTGTRPEAGPWWRNLAIPEMLKVRLASLWAASLGVLACCMLATFFTSSVTGGMVLVTMTGFSWAVTQWVPFALLGEAILTEPSSVGDEGGGIRLVDTRSRLSIHRRGSSESRRELALLNRRSTSESENRVDDDDVFVPGNASDSDGSESDDGIQARKETDERRKSLLRLGEAGVSAADVTPVLPNYREEEDGDEADEGAVLFGRSRDEEGGDSDEDSDEHLGGLSAKAGIILGIHNIFVVIPQFLVTGLSSIIFALMDPAKSVLHGSHPGGPLGPTLNHTVSAENATLRFMMRDDENELEMIQELQDAVKSDSVGVIFRIGGVSALIAFILCWRLAREIKHR
ncbi:major facilitator superfamily domain-containing protein [Rhodocollybia butyracea]|uniref:Major facilitator superfamily domain-containing protein n=1 Tax=Rhodocollybia butyracea TaxID=206335 RepID=A0A9P5Q0M7_9AGAR|nr:major facilitator superfamily domain-containing protein [Rhodocollybia butyracea]